MLRPMPRPSRRGASFAPLSPLSLALAVTAACGAELGGGSGPDAPGPGRDASVDAAVDAAPCTGGDAAMRSPTGACFFVFNQQVTYVDARSGCAASGAHLAILRSAQDAQVARTLVGANTAFLGLTDQATEGTFVWSDGSSLIYTDWYPGEPNDGGGAYPEDCAVISGARAGQWDDRPCEPITNVGGGLYSYLCQY